MFDNLEIPQIFRAYALTCIIRGGPTFGPVKYVKESESREAYACRLTFGPPQFLFESNDHVTQMYFWSAFKLIENSLFVQFELMKVDQKWVFEEFINHMTMNCWKTHFWFTFISSNWTKSEFLISLKADQKYV